MKKLRILRACCLSTSVALSLLFLNFAVYFSGQPSLSIVVQAADSEAEANAAGSLAAGTFTEAGAGCDTINGTDRKGEALPNAKENPYLVIANKEKSSRYDYQAVITEFLKNEDEIFKARVEELSGSDVECHLSKSDVPSALKDQRIKPIDLFVAERLFELRQADCALFAIVHSPYLLCRLNAGETATLADSSSCDKQTRAEISKVRKNLRYTMKVALMQADGMSTAWPLHKRLECLNEALIDLRDVLLEILQMYAKFPNTFINQAQSK